MTFDAKNLPEGLDIDYITGIITGVVKKRGEYNVTLSVLNKYGSAKRNLKIIIGDKLALTPPMGWNSLECLGTYY